MAIFEKYHPLLSAHYQLDWLTAFRLKDVFALRRDPLQAATSGRGMDQTVEETAHYVNKSMRLIMANEALLYGIGDRQTDQLLGTICLWNFETEPTPRAQLRFEVMANTAPAVLAEVIPRISGFAFFELGLTSLYARVPETATAAIGPLIAAGFTASGDPHTRQTADGQVVALVRLTLYASTVKNDPAFQF